MVDPDVQDIKNNPKQTQQNTGAAAYQETLQEDKVFLCITVQSLDLLPLGGTDCERGQRGMAAACGSDNWWKVSVTRC